MAHNGLCVMGITLPVGCYRPPLELREKHSLRLHTLTIRRAGSGALVVMVHPTAPFLFVTTSGQGKLRYKSHVQRTTVPTPQSLGLRSRLQTGHRTYRVEEARPPFTTSMIGPGRSKCVMPTASW